MAYIVSDFGSEMLPHALVHAWILHTVETRLENFDKIAAHTKRSNFELIIALHLLVSKDNVAPRQRENP